jgi:predicted MFS family arabinose efflux permease
MTRKITALISFICAVAVGNLYFAQPILVLVGDALQATPSEVGWVATLAQVGYGLGVLFLVPLGDVLERRRLIVCLLCSVAVALAAAGRATTLSGLVWANFFVGVTTVSPQVLIPYAASLTAQAQRATVLGTIQSGLLVGILLARTVAGAVAAEWGWRAIFFIAAGLSLALALLVRLTLPVQPAGQRATYVALLRSMPELFAKNPGLRRVGAISALNFASFSAFWTTLAFLLADSYHYGPGVVGLFGIVGVAGALGASAAGRMADRRGTAAAQRLACIVTCVAFAVYLASPYSLAALVLGVVLMDAGVQAAHIACQAEVFALEPAARSRLNGIYMFLRFAGGAAGSLLGAWSWSVLRWPGVCLTGGLLSLAALACVSPLSHQPSGGNVAPGLVE